MSTEWLIVLVAGIVAAALPVTCRALLLYVLYGDND